MINKINGCQCFNTNVVNNNNPKKHNFNILSMVANKNKHFIISIIYQFQKSNNYCKKQFISYINQINKQFVFN